jgi:hypothetical protein
MGSASISSPRLSKTAEPEAGRSGLRGRAPDYSNWVTSAGCCRWTHLLRQCYFASRRIRHGSA